MAKYLVRFLLSLSILISSGYSAIYASIGSDAAIDSYGASFENSLGVNNSRQHPLSYSESKEHGNNIFAVNNSKVEEEDKDFGSNDNFLDYQYFNALHFTRIFRYLFLDLSEDLYFSKFIPDTRALRLHVVIQVFRI